MCVLPDGHAGSDIGVAGIVKLMKLTNSNEQSLKDDGYIRIISMPRCVLPFSFVCASYLA